MIQLMQDLAPTVDHDVAEWREINALSRAGDQIYAQRGFHFGDAFRYGRLRHVECLRNGFDLLEIRQGDQNAQVLQLQSGIEEAFDGVGALHSVLRVRPSVWGQSVLGSDPVRGLTPLNYQTVMNLT